MDEALVIARLIHFAAAMTGFGTAAFRLYAVDDETARETAAALVLPLPRLAPGRYRVRWHVVSVDTHRTEGSFEFSVGQ